MSQYKLYKLCPCKFIYKPRLSKRTTVKKAPFKVLRCYRRDVTLYPHNLPTKSLIIKKPIKLIFPFSFSFK